MFKNISFTKKYMTFFLNIGSSRTQNNSTNQPDMSPIPNEKKKTCHAESTRTAGLFRFG